MRKPRYFSPAEWELLQYILEHHPIGLEVVDEMLIAGQPLEDRRSPKVEPKNEKPTPAPAKGVVRPAPGFPPHEKPSPA